VVRPAARGDALHRRRERIDVVDLCEEPVLAVADQLGRLADPRRHHGDAARHRLEHRFRPALLPRRHKTDVHLAVRARELVT